MLEQNRLGSFWDEAWNEKRIAGEKEGKEVKEVEEKSGGEKIENGKWKFGRRGGSVEWW